MDELIKEFLVESQEGLDRMERCLTGLQAKANGLAVDEVNDVLTVSAASFENNPCTLDARRKAVFTGVYKLRDGIVVRLEAVLLRPARLTENVQRREA